MNFNLKIIQQRYMLSNFNLDYVTNTTFKAMVTPGLFSPSFPNTDGLFPALLP